MTRRQTEDGAVAVTVILGDTATAPDEREEGGNITANWYYEYNNLTIGVT